MENRNNKMPFASILLVILHFLLGIGAIFGGVYLIIDPSGELINFPISLLEQSPFNSFLIPGIILFLILGVLPIILGFSLITKWEVNIADRLNIFTEKHWSWTYSIYTSFALIIWIILEIYFIQHILIVHVFYVFLGLAIQSLTLLPSTQKHYLK